MLDPMKERSFAESDGGGKEIGTLKFGARSEIILRSVERQGLWETVCQAVLRAQ